MAFIKRNWLARIGIGLNKFIIGDKDGEGKQTLTNSPDSVTQAGDVISADNLNDLEDRIAEEFDVEAAAIEGMKLEKIWENPSPDASYGYGQLRFSNDPELITDLVLEYSATNMNCATKMVRLKYNPNKSDNCFWNVSDAHYDIGISGSPSVVTIYSREFSIVGAKSNVFIVDDCHYFAVSSNNTVSTGAANTRLRPIAIYKVGTIYKS